MKPQQKTKINILIDRLENYNNLKNDWYIEKVVNEIRKIINN